MLSLATKISLIALWAIMAGVTLVKALPGGGGLDLATALDSRSNTPYIGVCFNNKKCDEGNTQGNSHNIEGDGKKDVGLSSPCDSFLPAISGGYACTGGCGGKGCSGLTQGKCMQGGPYKAYCVKA